TRITRSAYTLFRHWPAAGGALPHPLPMRLPVRAAEATTSPIAEAGYRARLRWTVTTHVTTVVTYEEAETICLPRALPAGSGIRGRRSGHQLPKQRDLAGVSGGRLSGRALSVAAACSEPGVLSPAASTTRPDAERDVERSAAPLILQEEI